MSRCVDAFHSGLEALSAALLFTLCGDVLLGVADRFVFHLGWPWPEELARFLLTWLSFLTAAVAARRDGHFVIDYFAARLFRRRDFRIFRVAMAAAVTATLLLVIIKGWQLTVIVASQASPALGLPMGWVYAAIPVGGTFTLVFVTYGAFEKSPRQPG